MLGKVGFGELGIIQSTVGLFGVLAGLGLGLTATKYVAEFREKDPAKTGRIIALSNWMAALSGSFLALALAFSAPWLAANTLAAPQLGGLLQAGSLLILLGAVNGVQTGALSGFEAFKAIALVSLWSGIASFPLMVVGAGLAGLPGVVWGLVGSLVVNWMLNLVALKRVMARARIPLTLSGWRQELPVLWKYSLPALLGGVMVGPATWASNALLVNQSNGYAEMGIFNAANQWFTVLMFLPGVLCQSVLPMLSEQLGYGNMGAARRILITSIQMNMAVIFPVVLLGCLFSSRIMSLYGSGFQDSWLTMVVALGTAGLLAVQAPVGVMLQASGKMWLAAVMNLGWGLAFLIGTFLFVKYGSVGLAAARAIAYAVHAIWTFAFAFHSIRSTR